MTHHVWLFVGVVAVFLLGLSAYILTLPDPGIQAIGYVSRDVASSPSSHAPDPTDGFSDEEVYRAALDILWNTGQIGPALGIHKGVYGDTIEQCDRDDATINGLRIKFSDYPNARMRREIIHWLDFYAKRNTDSRADMVSDVSVKNMEAYNKRRSEERERTQELLDKMK